MEWHTLINQTLTNVSATSEPLLHYGSLALFFLLALGILALPVPDETLMVAAGFLISRGKLNLPFTVVAAYLGAICGITLSYVIGRYGGSLLLEKYGHYIRLTEKRIEKTRLWFSRIGMWALFIGYFVPGIRHFTGYIVGSVRIPFDRFALFAYSGAVVWSSIFLSIGYLIGRFFGG